MAPFLASCDGRGTSRRTPPVTGRRPLSAEPWLGTATADASAGFLVEDEISADGVARSRPKGVLVVAELC